MIGNNNFLQHYTQVHLDIPYVGPLIERLSSVLRLGSFFFANDRPAGMSVVCPSKKCESNLTDYCSDM